MKQPITRRAVHLRPTTDVVCRGANFEQEIGQDRLNRRFLLVPVVFCGVGANV